MMAEDEKNLCRRINRRLASDGEVLRKCGRMSRADKNTLSRHIAAKVAALIARHGTPEKISGHQMSGTQIGDLGIKMATPFSLIKTGKGDYRYLVDIWQGKTGKVFSAAWYPPEQSADEFVCYRLVRGAWIDSLLDLQVGAAHE